MRDSASPGRMVNAMNRAGASGLGLIPSLLGGAIVGLLLFAAMLLGIKVALRGEIVPDTSSIVVTWLGLVNIFFGLISGGVAYLIQAKTRQALAAGTVPLIAALTFFLTVIVVITCCSPSDAGKVKGENLYQCLLWTTVVTYASEVCLLLFWKRKAGKGHVEEKERNGKGQA